MESNSTVHNLKTWPVYFDAVSIGKKRFEVRRNDRNFKVGDTLVLYRYLPETQEYDEAFAPIRAKIIYLLEGTEFGIQEGFVVIGFNRIYSE